MRGQSLTDGCNCCNLRLPYQAKVMKTFDIIRKTTVNRARIYYTVGGIKGDNEVKEDNEVQEDKKINFICLSCDIPQVLRSALGGKCLPASRGVMPPDG